MLAIALPLTQLVLVETSLPQLTASARNGFKCTRGLLQKAGFVTARTTLLGGVLIGVFLRFCLLGGFLLIGVFLRCGLRDRWPIWVRVGTIACRCSALVRRKANGPETERTASRR
jgi:hypothetical protein